MNRHLVAVKVGVERRAGKWMKLDCLAFDEDRLKRLDAQSVQRRCAVEHYGMLLDNVFQNIPYSGIHLFHELLRVLDVLGDFSLLQLFHYERLEQLQCHFLRNAALVNLHFGTDDDNRTAGIVDTLAQKVLSETAGLALEHVGQGLECPVAGSCDRAAASAVINKSVNRFLQHSLLVADDDVRRTDFQKLFQTVVTVDDSSVKIVQVRCCESSAVQLNHGTQIRRNDRNRVQNHPGRLVAAFAESFHYFQSLQNSFSLLALGGFQLFAECPVLFFDIYIKEQLLDCFRAHADSEMSAVYLAVFLIFPFGEDLLLHKRRKLQLLAGINFRLCRVAVSAVFVHDLWHSIRARVKYDVAGKIEHLFQFLRRHVKDQAHSGRNALEIPDVGNRSRELDVSHSLSSYRRLGYFNAASVADGVLELHLLVLAAFAFPVLGRAEDRLAEQSVLFRLQGSVVDRLRLRNFTIGPAFTLAGVAADLVRAGQPDLYRVKCYRLIAFICSIWHSTLNSAAVQLDFRLIRGYPRR